MTMVGSISVCVVLSRENGRFRLQVVLELAYNFLIVCRR